ncbi:aldose epimerase family protein [Thalassotalea fusca]
MSSVRSHSSVSIEKRNFGQLSDGRHADLFTLRSKNCTVAITNYGGIITSIITPDHEGKMADIVLGYDNVAQYEQDTYYLGAIIGRYAGRIKHGKISINGEQIQLELNAPDSQLHGGKKALNKQLWQAECKPLPDAAQLILRYTSPDGEEGFPGTVNFEVIYTLDNHSCLSVEYFAKSDQDTVINLTQHSYFNLNGHASGNIHDHQVQINTPYYLPMNEQAYPSGEVCNTRNTPFDFNTPRIIGNNIDSKHPQTIIGHGYDNYWVFEDNFDYENQFAAQVVAPHSGRRLTIFTDQPSIILYTANYIDGNHVGKDNYCYQKRAALCLEPQRAVDIHGKNNFTTTLLQSNSAFYSKTSYHFDVTIKD